MLSKLKIFLYNVTFLGRVLRQWLAYLKRTRVSSTLLSLTDLCYEETCMLIIVKIGFTCTSEKSLVSVDWFIAALMETNFLSTFEVFHNFRTLLKLFLIFNIFEWEKNYNAEILPWNVFKYSRFIDKMWVIMNKKETDKYATYIIMISHFNVGKSVDIHTYRFFFVHLQNSLQLRVVRQCSCL